MPLDFPASPSVNDTYSFGGKTWRWNGSGWQLSTGGGAINDIPIGNVTPSTGAFTAVSVTGNVTAGNVLANAYYFANGDPFTSGGSNVDLTAVASNITPTANVTYDIGSTSLRFRDIYLANSTIHLGSQQISASGNGLVLPNTVQIGNATIDGSSGGLILPGDTSIGGATAATPRITSIDYPGDDTAADPAGGQTLGIVGSGFFSGVTVILDGVTISPVTLVSSTRVEITAPAKSAGSYTLYVINSDGGTGIYVPGVQYSGLPTWSSPSAGSLGTIYETANVSATFSATSDSGVTYSLLSGTLPAGSSLDANTGVLSGTANLIAGSSVTYSFTVRATDAENQDTDRAFSLTVDADSVTWSSPTDGDTVSITVDQASTTTLSAASAAGDSITYSANALPTGLTLTGNTISGTANTVANTSVALTATADTTTRSSTVTVTFVVALPLDDEYFNSTTLLLNGDDNTFITDASDNAFTITPNGDTRPSAFSPYNTSWSNYFDGTGDYLQADNDSSLVFGTGDFTVEAWINFSTARAYGTIVNVYGAPSNYNGWVLYLDATGTKIYASLVTTVGGNAQQNFGPSTSVLNDGAWHHVALIRTGTTVGLYVDGVREATGTNSYDISSTQVLLIGRFAGQTGRDFPGYISNLRIIKGSGPYDATQSTITVPTAPLTAIAGTSLLTCQNNRLIDNSTNNFAITRNGDVKVTTFAPFTDTDTTTGSGYFDGTGDYLILDNVLAFGTNDWSWETWVYPTSFATINMIVDFRPIQGAGGYFLLNIQTNGKFRVFVNSAARIDSDIAINLNEWAHVCVQNVSGVMTMYVNGVAQTTTWTHSTNFITAANRPIIGRFGFDTSGQFSGYMSDIRVLIGDYAYKSFPFTPPTSPLTSVSNTSLLTLQNRIGYNNSQPIDESGIKNVITRNGNASAGTFSPHVPTGWSAYFDGTGDYLAIDQGAVNLENWYSQDYTIEMWVYPIVHAHSSPNAGGLYLSHGTYNTNGLYWSIGTSNTGYLRWYYYNGGAVTVTASTNPLSLNAWSHVALVYTHSTGAIKGYVNGTEVISGTKSGTPQSLNTNDLNVGVAQNTYFNGYISNLRIHRGEAVYTSAFTPPTAPLEPVASTSLLTLRGPGFTDDGPGRFAITRNGDTKITAFSPFAPNTVTPDSYSVYFDGTGDYLDIADVDTDYGTSSNFTIEFWMYPTIINSAIKAIIDPRTSDSSAHPLIWINASNRLYYFTTGADRILGTTTLVSDRWYHVALVRNNGTTTLYLDGSVEGTPWADTVNYISTTNFRIGQRYTGTAYNYGGYISNLRIVKDTAVYTSNFTPPTAQLTAISGTSLLTCQSPTVIDNSSNDFAITVNGNSQPTKFNPFGETVTTGVEYSPVSHGGSVYFDGTGDYLSLPGATSFTLPSTMNWTVECWIYPDWTPSSDYRAIFSTQSASGTSSQLLWATYGTEPVYLSVLSGGGGVGSLNLAAPNNVIRMRQWQHIALVNNGGTLRQYHNGVPLGSGTAGNYTSPTTITIGSAGTGSLFTGYIAGFNVLNGSAKYTAAFVPPAAPADPIAGSTLLINGTNAAIQDRSGRNVVETVGNARVENGVKKYGTGSMYFDGTGDYLNIPASSEYVFGTGDFTVECWIYPTTVSGSELPVFKLYGSVNSIVELRQVNNTMSMIFRSTSGSTSTLTSSAGTIVINTWHHLAFVRDNGTLRAFINGVQYTTATNTNTQTDTTLTIRVGTNQVPNAYFNGYIDDLRITKGVARYTANFTPPSATFALK